MIRTLYQWFKLLRMYYHRRKFSRKLRKHHLTLKPTSATTFNVIDDTNNSWVMKESLLTSEPVTEPQKSNEDQRFIFTHGDINNLIKSLNN